MHHLQEKAPPRIIIKDGKEESNLAYEVWLKGHYLASSKEQELHLKGELAIKKGDNESLENFIRKFKGICDSLVAIPKPLDDLDKVFQLSRVVGTRYQPYNLAVLSKAPYPTFSQYSTRLLNNERDIQVAKYETKDKVPPYAQVFVAQRGRGQRGHTALKCWYRFDHAYQSEELPQALASLTMMDDKDPNYYVDTAAIDRMTSELVSKCTEENPYIFEFSSNGFVIKDQITQAVVAKETRKGQLYALEEEEKHALAAISNKASDSIWHQRLGHPNSSVLKTLVIENNIVVSNWTKSPHLCSGCQMGKSYEWLHISSNLQPSGKLDEASVDKSNSTFVPKSKVIDMSIEEKHNTDFIVEEKEDQRQVELECSASASHDSRDSQEQAEHDSPLLTSSQSGINIQENEVVDLLAQDTSSTSQAPNSSFGGVPPPPHNATSTSIHSMTTRTKSGKHTGHVQTNFSKIVNHMTTTNPSSNDVGLDIKEPRLIRKALQLPHWVNAMKEELVAFHRNNTWTLVPAPSMQINIVGSKWVFRTKLNPNGSVESPVLKPTTLRLVIVIATTLSWPLKQLDVKNAFLHGTLKEELLRMGFCCSRAYSSLFILDTGHDIALLLLYVDDIVLSASSMSLLQVIIDHLSSKFALKDLGSLSYFLGIEVTKFSGGAFLSQTKYAKDNLTRASMLEAASIATPMALKDTITSRDSDLVDAQDTFSLTGFCDADWVGCPTTRRSTIGFCVFLGANCMSWSSKKQPIIACLTAEAEYHALASTTAEVVWITYLLCDIGIALPFPPQIFSDNISSLNMSINLVFHAKTKHIKLDYHFVQEKVALGTLITRYIPNNDQVADLLTKPLPQAQFKADKKVAADDFTKCGVFYWRAGDGTFYWSYCAGLILASWFLSLGVNNAEVLCVGLVSVAVSMLFMPLFKATGSVLPQMAPPNIRLQH
ncbi:hypothetical protein SLEP1_g42906 [Rubroshorea leprosula]|uniref:Reverse transcriptase Ty1/copia-type domain-containing protein n=1 Tax=Rubroshorea leprosula TaxID=152421 RepID=A0AAV5LBC4_9ROSI|nr:hypothetical protein SLEP1_g42906 [Rubroshorea leprosula]